MNDKEIKIKLEPEDCVSKLLVKQEIEEEYITSDVVRQDNIKISPFKSDYLVKPEVDLKQEKEIDIECDDKSLIFKQIKSEKSIDFKFKSEHEDETKPIVKKIKVDHEDETIKAEYEVCDIKAVNKDYNLVTEVRKLDAEEENAEKRGVTDQENADEDGRMEINYDFVNTEAEPNSGTSDREDDEVVSEEAETPVNESPRTKRKRKCHKKSSKDFQENRIKCCDCNMLFEDKVQLATHKINCERFYNFVCDKCNKTYHTLRELKLHTKTKCMQIKPYVCKVCNSSFSYKQTLNDHEMTKCGKMLFTCETCGKKYSAKTYYRQHMRTKCNTLKLFNCAVCKKDFLTLALLSKHLKQKCGQIKEFKCGKCSKEFKNKSCLTVHVVSNCAIYS